MRLNERQGFKQFVKSAKTAWQEYVTLRIANEHHLAYKKIPELQSIFRVDIGIGFIFHRQVDAKSA